MQYEELLKKAYEKVKSADARERFEVPQLDAVSQGNQTIIKNLLAVCSAIRREPRHLVKFLSKELASPASLGAQTTFHSKIPQRIIQQKFEEYIKEYVFCRECKRPDTRLVKEGRIVIMKCDACGARSAVKNI